MVAGNYWAISGLNPTNPDILDNISLFVYSVHFIARNIKKAFRVLRAHLLFQL
jgi:hypothetical protein